MAKKLSIKELGAKALREVSTKSVPKKKAAKKASKKYTPKAASVKALAVKPRGKRCASSLGELDNASKVVARAKRMIAHAEARPTMTRGKR